MNHLSRASPQTQPRLAVGGSLRSLSWVERARPTMFGVKISVQTAHVSQWHYNEGHCAYVPRPTGAKGMKSELGELPVSQLVHGWHAE